MGIFLGIYGLPPAHLMPFSPGAVTLRLRGRRRSKSTYKEIHALAYALYTTL